MDFLNFLLVTLTPDPIFEQAGVIAGRVFYFVTPVLLVIACYVRVTEEQLASVSGSGKWTEVARDFVAYGFAIGAYFLLFSLLIDLGNWLYAEIGSRASVAKLLEVIGGLVDNLNDAQDDAPSAYSFIAAPFKFVGWLCYTFALTLLVFIHIFFRLAMALLFSWVLISGLLALPVSVAKSSKILKGWLVTLVAAILWPAIESMVLWLLSGVMIGGINTLIADIGSSAMMAQWGPFGVYLGLAVMCLVIVGAMIAAPFMALSLANNTPAVTSVVGPMLGTAIAGAGMTTAAASKLQKTTSIQNMQQAGGAAKGALSGLASAMTPAPASPKGPRFIPDGFGGMKPNPGGPRPAAAHVGSGGGATPTAAAGGNGGGISSAASKGGVGTSSGGALSGAAAAAAAQHIAGTSTPAPTAPAAAQSPEKSGSGAEDADAAAEEEARKKARRDHFRNQAANSKKGVTK